MEDADRDEMLVTRRSKRSTAGNRMEAVLAEMGIEDLDKDMEDDNEFVNDKIEEDIFGSDFESTDEEAEMQAEIVGEKEIANEERRTKKTARTRLERVTAAAHAKNRLNFNPKIQISTTSNEKTKSKRNQHVSLGSTVDAETGKILQNDKRISSGKKRTSQRKHTVQNTSATVTRLKQSQAKRASQPKKAKAENKRYSQGELIDLALNTEEGNIIEHRDYLKNEAEKRKRARVVRSTVRGPLLRWISKQVETKVLIPQPPPPPSVSAPVISQAPVPSIYRSIYGPPGSLFTPTTYSYSGGTTMVSSIASSSTTQSKPNASTAFSPYQHYIDPAYSAFPMWPPPQKPYSSSFATPLNAAASTSSATINSLPSTTTVSQISTSNVSTLATTTSLPQTTTALVPSMATTSLPESALQSQTLPAPAAPIPSQQQNKVTPPEPQYRMEIVTKNYVIHEIDQKKEGVRKPTWAESMEAMFGDHVKWDQIKVFSGKGRPLSRPRQTCPITGRQAHYLDPRTGVPYADSNTYKVLTGLLRHEYVWNPSLGCYLDNGGTTPSVLESQRQSTESNKDVMELNS